MTSLVESGWLNESQWIPVLNPASDELSCVGYSPVSMELQFVVSSSNHQNEPHPAVNPVLVSSNESPADFTAENSVLLSLSLYYSS